MKFYVYFIYRGSLLVYIGKGCVRDGKDYHVFESLEQRRGTHFLIVFRTNIETDAFRMEDCLWVNLVRRGYTLENDHRPGRYGDNDNRSGWHHSEETKKRIREKKLGRPSPPKTSDGLERIRLGSVGNQRRKGMKHTDATKEKLRLSCTGNGGWKLSKETKELIKQKALKRSGRKKCQNV